MSIPGTIFQPNAPTDWSVGVQYVGPGASGLVLQSQYSMDTDEFGVTNLSRKWKLARSNKIANYLPQKGNVDFQYPTLQVFDYKVDGDGPYETLTVHYNGFLTKPGKPLVREDTGTQIREVTLYASVKGTIGARFGSLNMIYLAPTRTRRWATYDKPQLQNPYSVSDFQGEILRLGFKDASGIELTGDAIDFLATYFDYQERPVRVDFRVDHEGAVYRVSEVVELAVVQIAHVNIALDKVLKLGVV